ncbi:reverse transcriptase [Trichonephila clavipes]|nr:reverse transcriptase [Trichonephila clavipes]
MAGLRPYSIGIPSDERADQKAKQGAESTQPEAPLTLRRAKSIISTYIDKYTGPKNEFWKAMGETLTTVSPIPKPLERAESVAHFRLTTGHGFLGVYLHWLGVACSLCGHARMEGEHLLRCTGHPTDDIVSGYWEARRQMVKKSSTSVA